MVIAPAFLLAIDTPTADVTMGVRIRIGFDISLGCDGSLQAPFDAPVVGCIVSDPKLLWLEIRSRLYDIREFGDALLRGRDEFGVQANLENGASFGLACKLGIHHLIGPGPEVTWLLNAPKDIGASAPMSNLKSALRDDLRAGPHSFKRLRYGARFDPRPVYSGDRKPIRLKVLDIALFVHSTALRQDL